jgi:hypothetical protein
MLKSKLIMLTLSLSVLTSLSSSLSEDVFGEQSTGEYVINQLELNSFVFISEDVSKNYNSCADIVDSKNAKNIKQIEISYETRASSTVTFCYEDNHLIASTEAEQSDQLTVKIPKKLVYSISDTDCKDGNMIILMDREEASPINIIHSKKENVVIIEFPEGHHTIEFLGVSIIPDPPPTRYCGVVMGLGSQFLPPKFQIERGMKAEHVRCNEGLELLLKSNNGDPACIKPETKQILIERGWAKPF